MPEPDPDLVQAAPGRRMPERLVVGDRRNERNVGCQRDGTFEQLVVQRDPQVSEGRMLVPVVDLGGMRAVAPIPRHDVRQGGRQHEPVSRAVCKLNP